MSSWKTATIADMSSGAVYENAVLMPGTGLFKKWKFAHAVMDGTGTIKIYKTPRDKSPMIMMKATNIVTGADATPLGKWSKKFPETTRIVVTDSGGRKLCFCSAEEPQAEEWKNAFTRAKNGDAAAPSSSSSQPTPAAKPAPAQQQAPPPVTTAETTKPEPTPAPSKPTPAPRKAAPAATTTTTTAAAATTQEEEKPAPAKAPEAAKPKPTPAPRAAPTKEAPPAAAKKPAPSPPKRTKPSPAPPSTSSTTTAAAAAVEEPPAVEPFPDYSQSKLIEKMEGVTPKTRLQGEMTTIRLFISSTFVDTHGERDVLIRKVLPALNKELASRYVQIVPVDLRWGVSAEESTADAIQKTCLNEIDRCRVHEDEMPWFLGLRSKRYGWVQEKFNDPDDFEHPDRFAWMPKVQQAHPAGVSITSMEVWHAVLGQEAATMEQPHAFFAFRDHEFMKAVDEDWQWIFDFEYLPENAQVKESLAPQYTKTPLYSQYKTDLDTITSQIRSATKKAKSFDYQPGQPIVVKETGRLPTGKRFGTGSVGGLDFFAEKVYAMLFSAIDAEYPSFETELPALELSAVQHELMVRSRREGFVARDADLKYIEDYVLKANPDNKGLLITGPAGVGKSSLVAKAAEQLNARDNVDVVSFFVGTNPESFDLLEMLIFLIHQLDKLRAVPFYFEKNKLQSISYARSIFLKMLTMLADKDAPNNRVVVILDGLSQINTEYGARDVKWLPAQLPDNVRLIVTTSSDGDVHDNYVANCEPLQYELGLLAEEEAKTLVRTFLDTYHKKLCEDASNRLLGDQMKMLMEKQEARLPLYLLAAAAELVTFGVYEKVTPYLQSIPDHLPQLFNFVLSKLEDDHGEELVRATMSYIALSTDGIMEGELVELIESYPYTQPRKSTFARLFVSIKLYVTSGGSGLLRVFHEPIRKVIEERYLCNAATVRALNSRMLAYYRVKADPDGNQTYNCGAARPLLVLPHFERECNGDAAVAKLLTTPWFLKNKSHHCGLKTLRKDFRTLPKSDEFTLVHAINRTLTVSATHVSAEPSTICFHLAGRMYGLDLPGAKQFVEGCREVCDEYAPVTTGGLVTLTATILNSSEEEEEADTDSGAGGGVTFRKGLVGSVSCGGGMPAVAISPQANALFAVCPGNKMFTYSLPDLDVEVEQTIYGHYGASPVYTQDGKYMLTCSGPIMEVPESVIKVYESNSGTFIRDLSGHARPISKAMVLSTGEVVTCSWDKTIRFWNVSTGENTRTYTGDAPIQSMTILENKDLIVYGNHNDDIVAIKLSDLSEVKRSAKETDISTMAASSPMAAKLEMASGDDWFAIAYSYSNLKVFSVPDLTGRKIDLTDHGHTIYSIAPLGGKFLALACGDDLAIMDTSSDTVLRKYVTNSNTISSIATLPSHQVVAVSGNDMSVKVFGVELTKASASEVAEAEKKKEAQESKEDRNPLLKGFVCDLSSPKLYSSGDTVYGIDSSQVVACNVKTGLITEKWSGPNEHDRAISLSSVAQAPNGNIVIGSYDGKVRTFSSDFKSMVLKESPKSDKHVTCVIPLANGTIVAGDYAGTIRWIDGKSGKLLKKKELKVEAELFGCSKPGSNEFVIVHGANAIRFDNQKEVAKKTYPGDYIQIKAPYLKPNMKQLVMIQGFKVGMYDWKTLDEISTVAVSQSSYHQHGAMNADGTRYAAVSGQMNEVNVFDISGDEIKPLICLFSEIYLSGLAYVGDNLILTGTAANLFGFFCLKPTAHKGNCEPRWLTVKRDDEKKYEEFGKALMEKDFDTVKELLTPDIDINLPSPDFGMTMMHTAACRKKDDVEDVIKLLIDAGGDLSVKSFTGQTPFAMSISVNPKATEAMLKYDVEVNAVDNMGMTPLITAISMRKPELVKLLLKNGADPSVKNSTGQTTVALAVNLDEDIARMLMKTGKVDLNHIDNSGMFVLYTAVSMQKYDLAIDLINAGADPKLQSKITPISLYETLGMAASGAQGAQLESLKKLQKLMKSKGCTVSDTYKTCVPDWF
ncbi:hypothetical protein PTSG_05269 [Salpingoeca rosetta]|uniref:Uncharacterized protein n=1 Tax=Salpingoeca rosetta (strain ATCC 50818 / BSB-021) TaxID=946362 RepID=F2U9Y7_SALR5|nr:uncharacterized protein PTSG_05269 [Salpingoeca rosetta]EGD73562.1 hypothetical protein PTSG_05269 [Salpingoeca rosetta]|eukprot:XP_004993844.1 hypothetical protein PTSG_05269 [Salpingoeca rosetta]